MSARRALAVFVLVVASIVAVPARSAGADSACPVQGLNDCRSCPATPNLYDACLSDDHLLLAEVNEPASDPAPSVPAEVVLVARFTG